MDEKRQYCNNKYVFSQYKMGFRAQVLLKHFLTPSFPTQWTYLQSSRTILIFLSIVNMTFFESARPKSENAYEQIF